MTALPRAECPVCHGDVALRAGGQLREHRDHRDPMYGVGGGHVPLCPASGNHIEDPMCRKCGCTDNRACDEGCFWVEADLCSACAPEKEVAA
jgi:hypothetical protein